MTTSRMEAFSDGVIAILITIMVLELSLPAGAGWAALRPDVPELLTYVLSFIYLGIYWNNHHHMLHLTTRVTGVILWANLLLLFWLSLVPFSTHWLANQPTASVPTACYGIVLICAAFAYTLLQAAIVRDQGSGSRLRRAVGHDRKGKLSLACYAAGIALAFVRPWLSDVLFACVAIVWLVPDRRIETFVTHEEVP